MGHITKLVSICTIFYASKATAFHLYPTLDPVVLAGALNISTGCLDALNTTVACDDDLFLWTNFVDDHWWTVENTTTLCTSTCTASAQSWMENVFMSCLTDTLTIYGKEVPADTVAGRYVDGLGIACLQSPSTSDWCIVESLSWVGSDVIRPDCSVNPNDPSCINPANVTLDNERMANLYSDTILCDDCFMNLFHQRLISDFLPDSYHSDYLVDQFHDIQDVCSKTIAVVSTRGFSGYPSATPVPTSTNGTEPGASTTTTPISVTTATSTTPTTSSIVTPTPTHGSMISNCNSFYFAVTNDTCYDIAQNHSISVTDFEAWNSAVGSDCLGLWAGYYYCVGVTLDLTSGACQQIDTTTGVSSTDGFEACNQLSTLYNVPTGTLLALTSSSDCYSPTGICAPASCHLMNVTEGSTCASLVSAISANATSGKVTMTQFLSWNPFLLGTCDNLTVGQQICAGASGGSYIPPPSVNGTSNDGSQERGGPGGADPTGITGTTSFLVTSQAIGANPTAAPAPTQAGIVTNCNRYANASGGDTCASFASKNGITPDELYAWNSVLGAGGSQCSTQLWKGTYYCIGIVGLVPGSTTPASPKPTTTSITAPGPTQTGITTDCNKFAQAPSGATCTDFAASNGITTAQLYAWNTVLGPNGVNCGTSLWAKEYYCVGVKQSASTTTKPTTPTTTVKSSVTPPGPTQTGIASNCNKYALAPKGGTCTQFASTNSITVQQLYKWNPVLGPNGENCASSFWASEAYCVGVSS